MAKNSGSSNKNSIIYDVNLYNERGIRELVGDVVGDSDGVITFRYKLPKSSRYGMEHIDKATNLVGLSGGIGQKSTILFYDRVLVKRLQGYVEPEKGGMLKVTQVKDGQVFTVRMSACRTFAKKDVNAPPEGLQKKSKPGPATRTAKRRAAA